MAREDTRKFVYPYSLLRSLPVSHEFRHEVWLAIPKLCPARYVGPQEEQRHRKRGSILRAVMAAPYCLMFGNIIEVKTDRLDGALSIRKRFRNIDHLITAYDALIGGGGCADLYRSKGMLDMLEGILDAQRLGRLVKKAYDLIRLECNSSHLGLHGGLGRIVFQQDVWIDANLCHEQVGECDTIVATLCYEDGLCTVISLLGDRELIPNDQVIPDLLTLPGRRYAKEL